MQRRAVWALAAALLGAASGVCGAQGMVRPGEVWLDDRGQPIQAHGGGMLRLGDEFFWFGEDRSRLNDASKRYVACYSSKDLVHWRFRRQVLALADPENLGPRFVLERPKVFYNARTRTYVLYMHLDAPGPGGGGGYQLARVAVATSPTVDGEYKYVRSFRPLGKESRDIGQFIDDDGKAYLIFESRPTGGFYIAQLSDDYLNVEKEISFVHAPLEGGAIVHYGGRYYMLGSHLTGWKANPNVYASAPSLAGPWTDFKDVAPPAANTYDSQSSMLLKIAGTKTTDVIYMGDRWNSAQLFDSRYVWMPMQLGDGQMQLPEPRPWSIDVKTGVITMDK
jgi:hypothetical protein